MGTPPGAMLQRGYTRAVPATRIAQDLAFINWTVLTGLALGSYAAVILLRRRSDATRGYLGFTSPGAPILADPAWDAPRRAALIGFCAVATAALVARRVRPAFGEFLEWTAL